MQNILKLIFALVNGNILTLNRTGINPFLNQSTDIDALTYSYDTGNKLLRVTDTSLKNEGFTEPENQTGNDYAYDIFGNLTSDHNKKITNIVYNHLNLPLQITFSGTNKFIDYLYRADGSKLMKKVTDGTNIILTDYLTGFQYSFGVLNFFPHSERYVQNSVQRNGDNLMSYVYNHTDHLGNVRLSFQIKTKMDL